MEAEVPQAARSLSLSASAEGKICGCRLAPTSETEGLCTGAIPYLLTMDSMGTPDLDDDEI